ncbi:GAF domain-containing protein [Paralcaligenes ureilyticus]|uniref:GAF domain-containing protein n=2 Tax=Paralcaligenes ureilyticus TaxID=627131 RepID=A0A4R3LWH6_9BURK|nr:GAF domain-containing protein [Paralcaligenes ureilyticus]
MVNMAAHPEDSAPPIEQFGLEIVNFLYHDADKLQFAGLIERAKSISDRAVGRRLMDAIEMGITLKERFALHQQRERGLLALIETAQDLTAITDLDRVLQAIVQRARKLIGCDVGYLSIYDPEQDDFYVRATDGAFSEKFKQVRVGLAVGICGFVARTKAPYSSSDYGVDSRFAHTRLIDTAVLDENIKSILGVPLLAGEQVIGVLFVGDRYIRSYVAWEMSILSTLAAHASVAIGNARLFEQAQMALEQASRTNVLLSRQTADTRNAAEAHEQLTALAAKGGSLKDICDKVAGMLGGHVVVYDGGEQEVCASAGSPCRLTDETDPSSARDYEQADRIHVALGESRILGRSVIAFDRPSQVCRVSAMIGGRGMLGGLVIYTAMPLNDVAIRIFERSSMVTAVVLLSQEHRELAALAQLPTVLRGLVSAAPRDSQFLVDQAGLYGLDLSLPICMVVIEADANRYALRRLRGEFQMPSVLFGEMDGLLVFFCHASSAGALRQALQLFFLKQLRVPLTGVVSVPVESPVGLPRVYDDVRHCLRFLKLLNRSGSLFLQQELSLYSVLFDKQNNEDIRVFLASTLGGLYCGQEARKIELAQTLLAYLDHGHNARTAAESMGIHINTFRQRLAAIDVLLGSWRGSTRALEIHMALRLWRLSQEQQFAA